ncbi:carboxypeptidase regulatory-like domain-containing protein [Candidatus Poribacteria bacterium]|nr:carboxypeptidase regulatory-like domain-containing protein [Candidatus Poribacteria bacterium]MBT5535612.1 carboxypeptidase regulatory-like domain-containing protein [Candidatus Poribacteria bacterium]MBT7095853.1 carboxypeptidase regulatory-like domain-containing protein [Candidatus Poribacteria bacterium]MBT7805444.1 carboxypeptidase regulatory-like domain-containing protein [Candidatus Poribacteria bacterium]
MSARAGAVVCIGLLLIAACGAETPTDTTDVGPVTGTIEGFTAPIDISLAEVVVFVGDREVRRAEFRHGEFSVADLPAGVYRLEVRAFGYQVNDAARDVVLAPGQSLDLGRFVLVGDGDLMADIPRVTGTLTDAVSAVPVAGAAVQVTCSAGICSVQRSTTDADGGFVVLAPAEQDIQVSFLAEGYDALFLSLGPISLGAMRDIAPELQPALR